MPTVAVLTEILALDGTETPAFIALYNAVASSLTANDRAQLDLVERAASPSKPASK